MSQLEKYHVSRCENKRPIPNYHQKLIKNFSLAVLAAGG